MNPFPYRLNPTTDDEKWMFEALKQAYLAFEKDEVPIGAVLVSKEGAIARGYNQVELLNDATAHAEMLAITGASASLESWRLPDTTLYTTIEPCSMCAGAIYLARIPRLVWAAPDIRHGANGSWVDLFEKKHPTHTVSITSGVYREYAADLMRTFFEKKRSKNGVE